MNQCYRCGGHVPEPNLTEAINREMDWRDAFPDESDKERVLICIPCADELAEIFNEKEY